jgi:hypothetical protein
MRSGSAAGMIAASGLFKIKRLVEILFKMGGEIGVRQKPFNPRARP